ncbi:MAG: S8 family serine peptidase [Caldilineaceae bacterium]
MKGKYLQLSFVFVLLISLLSPAPIAAMPANTRTTPPKIQDYLLALAATDPDEMVAVIVQKEGESATAETLVATNGGQVTKALPLINAFVARLPAHAVTTVAASPAVKWVSLDAPVATTNNTGLTIADDFVDMTYNGSTGTYAWAGDWQEVGEADGAALGDVAVTTFWGGALQGLRLQGSTKGALRQLNLADATAANLHLSYRRKGFESEADFVVIELSSDGGAQWQEVGRLAGPVTDAEIQYVSYDISAYRSAATLIRLTTAADFSEQARFYLDTISVDLTLDASLQPVAANRLYLPLATSGAALEEGGDAARWSKTEWLARNDNSARNTCGYVHCVDLVKLNSNYIKAIRADQIWNASGYLRGWGVGVAIVDSGIDDHPDLNDYVNASRLAQRVNFVPGATTPDDYYGHGTHIAGIIGGLGQNSGGVYMGVALEARLIDVRVMNDRGHGNTSNVVEGLQWIYNNRSAYNIKVVNLSLNSRIPESYNKSALNAALEVLWFNKIVVVVSAGNGGKQRLYPPANDPFVITVGAVDDKGTVSITDDTLSPFSAYGMTSDGFLKPDLVAPGSNIVSVLASDDSNLVVANPSNTVTAPNNSRYFKMSGTSMAAAVVAGAVSILLEGNPSLTPDQVKYRLRATARPFTGPESCAVGAGYLDLYAAINSTTTQNANTGIAASQRLWSGTEPITWGSVSWNSVSWNSVSWNSVSWNSVSWNSTNWNSVSWNSNDTDGGLSNGSCGSAIGGLTLVNADTDQDIQPLYDGAVVNLDAIGTTNLTVRADVVGVVSSVKFALSGSSTNTQMENKAPYTLAGDNDGTNYVPYPFGVGSYRLKAQSYSGTNAGGSAGGGMDIEFTIAGATRCNVESIVRPKQNTKPITLQVKNNSSTQLELFWINSSGVRQSHGVIAPGQTKVQATYDTHPWIIARDSDNACLYLMPNVGNEPEVSYPLASSSTTFNGNYLVKAVHSNKCADVDGASTANQANISQGSCSGQGHIWTITPTSDGAYTLKALHSGKCMEVASSSTANGANVRQNSCTGSANQKWRIEFVGGDGYKLIAVHSGQALKVWNGATTDGTNIAQWPYYGAAFQHWLLQPTN